jgi:hypothetical protein
MNFNLSSEARQWHAIVTLCVVMAGVIMYRADQRRERDIQAAIAANR